MYKLFNSAESTWQAQIDDINCATKSIYLEQYILKDFAKNEIGAEYIDALLNSAKKGVKIRIILDLQGSIDLFKSNEIVKKLEDAGVFISFYKTLPWSKAFSPIRLMLRDHRKFIVIDDNITWVGGVVIGERFRRWHDLMVRYDNREIAQKAKEECEHQFQRISGDKIILAPYLKMDEHTKMIGNSPGLGNRFCYETISHNMLTATKEIWLVTPYFAPPWRLKHVIKRLLQEGVKINLLVPRKSDTDHADWARETYLNKFIHQGLTVYYLNKMNHAKVVIVDDNWCTVGSTNMDMLSLLANHELNITSTNQSLINDVTDQIKDWIKDIEPVMASNDLFYSKMSWWQRMVGYIARYIS